MGKRSNGRDRLSDFIENLAGAVGKLILDADHPTRVTKLVLAMEITEGIANTLDF